MNTYTFKMNDGVTNSSDAWTRTAEVQIKTPHREVTAADGVGEEGPGAGLC